MRRVLSLILIFTMIFCMTSNIFAFDNLEVDQNEYCYMGKLDDSDIYTVETLDKEVAIVYDIEKNFIDMSIKYKDNPNKIYQWDIEGYEFTDDNQYSRELLCNELILYAENNLERANIITITTIEEDSNEPPKIQPFSSAGADLIEDMEKDYGKKYFGNLKHTAQYSGKKFYVFQSLDYRVSKQDTSTWSKAMTVSSLITGVLGLKATTTLVKVVCNLFDVVVSAASKIPSGKLVKYKCFGMQYRYVTMKKDKDAYAYNITDKFINYKGYENPDLNSKSRAYIDVGSKKIEYIDGSSYYSSYDAQVKDAYKMYQNIGAM